jgi:hypothetical protein
MTFAITQVTAPAIVCTQLRTHHLPAIRRRMHCCSQNQSRTGSETAPPTQATHTSGKLQPVTPFIPRIASGTTLERTRRRAHCLAGPSQSRSFVLLRALSQTAAFQTPALTERRHRLTRPEATVLPRLSMMRTPWIMSAKQFGLTPRAHVRNSRPDIVYPNTLDESSRFLAPEYAAARYPSLYDLTSSAPSSKVLTNKDLRPFHR